MPAPPSTILSHSSHPSCCCQRLDNRHSPAEPAKTTVAFGGANQWSLFRSYAHAYTKAIETASPVYVIITFLKNNNNKCKEKVFWPNCVKGGADYLGHSDSLP